MSSMDVIGVGGDRTDEEASDEFGSAFVAVDVADGNDGRKASAAGVLITIVVKYSLNRAANEWPMAMETRID